MALLVRMNYQRTLGTEKSIDTMRPAFDCILNAADSDDRQVLDGLVAVYSSRENNHAEHIR